MSDSNNDDELRRKNLRPSPADDFVIAAVKTVWGFETTKIKKLESYDDCNYFINASDGESYLVKFYNVSCSIPASIFCKKLHLIHSRLNLTFNVCFGM